MARVRERYEAKSNVFGDAITPELRKFAEKLAGKKTEKEDQKRFIFLSWALIEWKIAYYYPDYIKADCLYGLEVSDSEFDSCMEEYYALCIKHGWQNTVGHSGRLHEYAPGPGMFEVDFTRPSVHLVMRKFGVKGWQEMAAERSSHDTHVKYCSLCGTPTELQKVEEPEPPKKPKRNRSI